MNADAINNPAAEWSIVASMVSDSSIVAEVVGSQLSAEDFVRPDAKLIYSTAVEMYFADQTVEPLTVAERAKAGLAKEWDVKEPAVADELLKRLSDRDYGRGVMEHAAIVRQHATARRLLSVCNSAIQSIGEGKRTPEEIAGTMSTDALSVTGGMVERTELLDWMGVGTDYAIHLRRMRLAREKGIEMAVYTGFGFIDNFTKGIAPTELAFIAGAPGVGKALALDTPLPTPSGWTTMAEVQRGWMLLGADGRPVQVEAVSEVLHGRPCYRVAFSDGSQIIADAEHQWQTTTRLQRVADGSPGIATTREIADSLRRSDGGFNHRIQNHPGLELEEVDGPVDPYLLGVWLGDGNTRNGQITVGKLDSGELLLRVHDAARGADVKLTEDERADRLLVDGLGNQLFQLGVLHNKHIPTEYLRGSARDREALFEGLVDSDGSVREDGRIDLSVMVERLAEDIFELACTLGLKPTLRKSRATLDGRFAGWRYRLSVMPDGHMARLDRKRRGTGPVRGIHRGRFIVGVTQVPSRPVKCVQVRAGDSMYLAGRTMIPTHNSVLAWKAAEGFASRQMKKKPEHRQATLVVSMEMGHIPSSTRLAQSISGVDGMRLREGDITDAEYQKILREWKARDGLPIYFNYASNFRLSQLRALIVEGIRRYNVGFVVLDHFRQIDTDRFVKDANDRDETKVRFLKESLAKDLDIAVLCLAHTVKVGRGADGKPVRPRLDDLRGSGTIAANADFVGFMFQPGKNMDDVERMEAGIKETDAELIWEKARHTGDGTAFFSFEPRTMTVK